MIRYLPLILLPFLAACDETAMNATMGVEPEAPVYPAAVLAALPPGVPPSVAFLGPDGCYAVGIELTDPQQGYPLRDVAGLPVCNAEAVAAYTARMAENAAATVPAPTEQANPDTIVLAN